MYTLKTYIYTVYIHTSTRDAKRLGVPCCFPRIRESLGNIKRRRPVETVQIGSYGSTSYTTIGIMIIGIMIVLPTDNHRTIMLVWSCSIVLNSTITIVPQFFHCTITILY